MSVKLALCIDSNHVGLVPAMYHNGEMSCKGNIASTFLSAGEDNFFSCSLAEVALAQFLNAEK